MGRERAGKLRTLTRGGAGFALAAALIAATAGRLPAGEPELPPPGERAGGEEAAILARIDHFARTRGLGEVERPDLVRRAAVEELRGRALEAGAAQETLHWTSLGPWSMTMLDWDLERVSGRVSALAVHPADDDVLYLGAASGGLWKSIDGGASWQPIFDEVGTQTIGSITIDPSDPDTLWVGTGEQGQDCWSYFGMGLYRSTDGGASFEARNGVPGASLDLSYVTAVAVHGTEPQLVLAGGESWCDGDVWRYGGLFRSTDAGATWQSVLNGIPVSVTDLLVHPTQADTVFAAVGRWGNSGNGIYRSSDFGATWQRLENGLPYGNAVGRSRLAAAEAAPGTLYALMNVSGGVALYRSTDDGESWTLANPSACEGQCWYNLCLDVDPADPDHLLVGSIRFFESTDGGLNLSAMTHTWGGSQEVHQDTHVLRFSRLTGGRFWVGSDGGVWRSDDSGASYLNLNANLDITQFYDIAVHPSDGATVFGGAQDNSSSRRSGDQLWDTTVVTGDGFVNLVDPADPMQVIQTSYPYDGYPSLFHSAAGGAPFSFGWLQPVGVTQGEPWPWVTPLAIIGRGAGQPSLLLLGSDHVYRGRGDALGVWTKISGDLSDASISVLQPALDGATVVGYVGTQDGRIHRSDDLLAPLVAFKNVTGDFPGGNVTDLAVSPADWRVVYATRGELGDVHLLRSTSGGTTWRVVGSGLPQVPASTVAVDPLDPRRVFVGTDVGVFESTDAGFSFRPATAGMPLGAVVTDLEVDDDPHILTAGTYGRGAWQAELGSGPLFADGFESGDATAWADSP